MKLLHKTITTLLAVIMTAALIIFGASVRADDHLLVRKNVLDLTPEEKTEFVNAIQTLKNTIEHDHKTNIYDEFVAQHVEAMELMSMDAQGPAAGHDGAHESSLILPWHREFIHRFEKALQSVNPHVTLPYWDWTDPEALDVIFQDDFMGPNGQGVTINIPDPGSFQGDPVLSDPDSENFQGGSVLSGSTDSIEPNGQGLEFPNTSNVVSVQGGPVLSGPFSEASGWIVNPDLHSQASGESLGTSILRFLRVPPVNIYPIPKEDVDQILAVEDYDTFRIAVEGFAKLDSQGQLTIPGVFMHNYFHSFVGGATFDPAIGRPKPLGTMGGLSVSINDPVFWLVHSNLDRLWAEWQSDGHAGSDYYPATGGHYGENLLDRLWPWDAGESTPGNKPGDVLCLLPALSPDDIVTPRDTLDFTKYGYTYATLSGSQTEPAFTLGLFGLGAFGAVWQLLPRRKQKVLKRYK